jgi:hypothetical protein
MQLPSPSTHRFSGTRDASASSLLADASYLFQLWLAKPGSLECSFSLPFGFDSPKGAWPQPLRPCALSFFAFQSKKHTMTVAQDPVDG